MRGFFRRYFITACLLIGPVLTQINLKELLTPTEWISILGNLNTGGRSAKEFDDSSVVIKRRKTVELRKEKSAAELAFATAMKLHEVGNVDAAKLITEATTTSPKRASRILKSWRIPKQRQFPYSIEEAVAMLVNLNLTREQYVSLRHGAKEHGHNLYPPYYKVLEAKKEFYPPEISISEEKCEVPLQNLLNRTCESILKCVSLDTPEVQRKSLLLTCKWGFDGSSSFSSYKQRKTRHDDHLRAEESLFTTSVVPLQLSDKDSQEVLWKNPHPASKKFCRPVKLQWVQESEEVSRMEQVEITEQINQLKPYKSEMGPIHFNLLLTMVDGKVCSALSKTSSMTCHICKVKISRMNDIVSVRSQQIDKENLQFGLSVLHAYIRCFECLLHISYRLELKVWKVAKKHRQQFLARKTLIQNEFRRKMGLLVDIPKSGFGTTNDGNTARRFFANPALSSEITVGNYTITYPNYIPPDDESSAEQDDENDLEGRLVHRLQIKAPELGQNFSLELEASPKLLANEFTLLETFSNGSNPLYFHNEDKKCYFRGPQTAVSICDGVRGIVHVNEEDYFIIHPLPKRFHNESSKPHVLIRKSHKINPVDVTKSCPHYNIKKFNNSSKTPLDTHELESNETESLPFRQTKDFIKAKVILNKKNILKRRKRETFPDGAPAFVETAVFVDKDLFDHMKTNFPIDTERELIRFVLAMINAVQLLYHDASLGRPVNFVLKRLEILKEEAAGLLRPPDIDRFLSNFCNWQRTKNPAGDREPLHWDHALILTGLDLYVRGKHGKISSQVVGLAPVAGMCTATSSCTVNEGRHFESVYVVAHEIGHNLGMRHDGPLAENDCDPSSYIMSPTLGSGKITWSPCSKRYLQKFLDTPQSRCLLDHGSSAGQLDHSAEGILPGERFDANQQCMLKYGRGSKHSTQQPLDDVCRDLHCERERYTWTSHPALEGTMCGNNMWCRGGRCVVKGLALTAAYTSAQQTLSQIEKINGGWSKWKSFSDCASGCLFGEEGRLRSGSTGIMMSERKCNNPRPQGAGAQCEGASIKYSTCTAQQCFNVPRLTIREFAEQICTRAKDVDKDLTGSGMQKISTDPEEACLVWCQKRNGGTKSRGWTFPDGTACQIRRNRYGKASYCIKGRCEEFVCDPYDEAAFAQSPELCPVDKDDNELNWRTGLRRREGAIRWKSASGCHYNCISPGSGIRLVMSKGKYGRSSIQLCQPDKYGCGRVKSPFHHASMVCAKYKERVRRLSGLGMQISPAVEDPDRPCRVACQDDNISHRFYLVNGEEGWFPFGTDCSRGSREKKAYCISGKCLEFGTDDTPLSESEFTLPLLSRSRRSLQNNSTTKVTAKLNHTQLQEIIDELNRTLSGKSQSPGLHHFDIDLDNPIHVNVDMEPTEYPQKFKKNDYDYANYA